MRASIAHGTLTVAAGLLLVIWFDAPVVWWVFVLLISIGIGAYSYSFWLTWEQLDAARIADENERLRNENEQLRSATGKLREKVAQLQTQSGSKPTKIRQSESEPPHVPVKRKERPRNAEAALTIHQAWINDVSGGAAVNREYLMRTCGMSRDDVELGWDLLSALDFARKEDERPNAKWVITNLNDLELREAIDAHISSAKPGMVHGV